jgi:hypothetical protein
MRRRYNSQRQSTKRKERKVSLVWAGAARVFVGGSYGSRPAIDFRWGKVTVSRHPRFVSRDSLETVGYCWQATCANPLGAGALFGPERRTRQQALDGLYARIAARLSAISVPA